MTPPRLTELRCPNCRHVSWVIDSDYRGMDDDEIEPYGERHYRCGSCVYSGPGWEIGQQSPPEFLLQPHDLYPMTQEDFDYWVGILRTHFPDHPRLSELRTTFIPRLPEEVEAMREAHARAHPVAEMRDQDGARRADPELETAIEWLNMMKAGDTLVLSNRQGGSLKLTLEESGFSARCLNGTGDVLAETRGLKGVRVFDVIEYYFTSGRC